jgi:hypothetical protein
MVGDRGSAAAVCDSGLTEMLQERTIGHDYPDTALDAIYDNADSAKYSAKNLDRKSGTFPSPISRSVTGRASI